MLKVVHVDLETTGDDPARHGVHQIAGGIAIEDKIVEDFFFKVRPHPLAAIDLKALAVSGTTVKELQEYELGLSVIRKLCYVLDKYVDTTVQNDKFFLSGFGVSHFDEPFLKKFFTDNSCGKFKSYFYTASIDTQSLAANALRYERIGMQNFKLETVARRFNIDADINQQHNASYDWRISHLLYNAINKI